MMQLIFLLDSAQNANGVFQGWFADHKRLKTPRQRGIFFNILPVFIQCSGANAMQLTARQRWLNHIRRIHGAIRLTSPN